MPKIVLFALNSSFTNTNLAVRCIKKSLDAAGFSCVISEFNLKDKQRRVLEALYSENADVYGFSTYIWNISEMYRYASDLKKLLPHAKIVFGGPEVSYDAEEILDLHPFIDCIIKGEGERAFVTLAAALRDNKPLPPILDGGIFEDFYKQGMVYAKEELSDAPRIVYYESSRGCPYRCAYCLSAVSGKVRAKSAADTLLELVMFEELDNIKIIKFVDRTFNFDKERAKEIWSGLLSEQYTKNYHFEICADLLCEESFEILSRFPKGKIQLEIGVQSTNIKTLRSVNRNSDTDDLINKIKRLYDMGNIHIHVDLIAGLPHESIESFARSYDSVFGKCDMLQLGFLKLLRGSELRRRVHEFGCIYSSEPPYEVLSTDCLSFYDITRLKRVDELADRYLGGSFSRSMKLILSRCDSPFGMLDSLGAAFAAEDIRISGLSQPNAFEKLYDFMHEGDDVCLAEALLLDFLTSQKLSPPKIGGHELKRGSGELKRAFMKYADSADIEYFAPGLEERVGLEKYIIDRKNKRAYLYENGQFAEI